MEFSETSVKINTDGAESRIEWKMFEKVVATKSRYALLFRKSRMFYWIPRSAFLTIIDANAWETMVLQHVSKSRGMQETVRTNW